jgi:predicted NAD-dependent protein-ADP-ribosyltransferase YbiA (DUF1768 family)
MITIKNRKFDILGPNDFPVHRGFPLGNPFSHLPVSKAEFKVATREESIKVFAGYFIGCIKNGEPAICDAVNELIIKNLRGEDLGLVCYCVPNSCHATIIRDFVLDQKYCINWFSNMRPLDYPFIYQNIEFKTVENFYQAMKLPQSDIEGRRYIAGLNPYKSKLEIKKLKQDPTFHDRKLEVMEYGLRKKFAPNTSWHEKLLKYDGEIIEWNNWKDEFWGKCIFSGKGQNNLGRILTTIKNES